jgi:hypothetical protein
MTTIATTGMAALSTHEKKFKENIEAAIDGAVGNNTLTSAHIFVGNASNVAADVAVTGPLSITNGGVTSFASTWGKKGTTDTNGEIALTGMTAAGVALVVPNESVGAIHVVPGTDKLTVYSAGTTNVVASKSFAVLAITKS